MSIKDLKLGDSADFSISPAGANGPTFTGKCKVSEITADPCDGIDFHIKLSTAHFDVVQEPIWRRVIGWVSARYYRLTWKYRSDKDSLGAITVEAKR